MWDWGLNRGNIKIFVMIGIYNVRELIPLPYVIVSALLVLFIPVPYSETFKTMPMFLRL